MAMFAGSAEHYDEFMGRYAFQVAAELIDDAAITPGMRVLDVGCGPGTLTGLLVSLLGATQVAAIDPAPQFATATHVRNPGADVRTGGAEDLPWSDDTFDAALACLVIGFMSDPEQGCREMARVVRPGGTVAACMWDIAGDRMGMLARFWDAVRSVHPEAGGEHAMPGTSEGEIAGLFERVGLDDVVAGEVSAHVDYPGFEDFWRPLTYGIGPAGQYLVALPDSECDQVREACRAALPSGAFTVDATAWCARGTVAAR